MPQLHRNPPFRAEHLGSLLRTDELLKTKTAYEAGQVPKFDLTAIENKDIKDIVETQKKIGFPALSDGEYTRHSMFIVPHSPSSLSHSGLRSDSDSLSVLGHLLPWS